MFLRRILLVLALLITAGAVSALIVLNFRAGSHAAANNQDIRDIDTSTILLKGRMAGLATATSAERSQIQQLARSRHEAIVRQLEMNHDDPAKIAAIGRSLSVDQQLESLPDSVRSPLMDDVEHTVSIKGIMSVFHADSDSGSTIDYPQITDTATGRSYRVFSSRPIDLEEGSKAPATVTGMALGADVVVGAAATSSVSVGTATTTAAVTGGKKILAVLIKFSNTAASELTITQPAVYSQLFTATNSVKNYMEKSSYGLVTFDVANSAVVNWVTLKYAKPTSTSGCSYTALQNWAADANTKLPAGMSATNYNHVIYIFPRETNCATSSIGGPWSGWADVPGSRLWVNGMNYVRVYSHELQHNFGLSHATAIDCGGSQPIAAYSTCKTAKSASDLEYLDVYDNMGSGGKYDAAYNLATNNAIQTNARYKMQLGWLSSSRMVTVSASTASVTLLPYETPTSTGYQVIKIPAAKLNSADSYYVEYRTPTNVDNAWPISALSPGGLVIRLYGNTSIFHASSPAVTAIVDAAAPYATAPYDVAKYYDSALKNPGTSTAKFVDPVNNVVIKLTSATATAATVCVGIGNTSYCDQPASPTPPPALGFNCSNIVGPTTVSVNKPAVYTAQYSWPNVGVYHWQGIMYAGLPNAATNSISDFANGTMVDFTGKTTASQSLTYTPTQVGVHDVLCRVMTSGNVAPTLATNGCLGITGAPWTTGGLNWNAIPLCPGPNSSIKVTVVP